MLLLRDNPLYHVSDVVNSERRNKVREGDCSEESDAAPKAHAQFTNLLSSLKVVKEVRGISCEYGVAQDSQDVASAPELVTDADPIPPPPMAFEFVDTPVIVVARADEIKALSKEDEGEIVSPVLGPLANPDPQNKVRGSNIESDAERDSASFMGQGEDNSGQERLFAIQEEESLERNGEAGQGTGLEKVFDKSSVNAWVWDEDDMLNKKPNKDESDSLQEFISETKAAYGVFTGHAECDDGELCRTLSRHDTNVNPEETKTTDDVAHKPGMCGLWDSNSDVSTVIEVQPTREHSQVHTAELSGTDTGTDKLINARIQSHSQPGSSFLKNCVQHSDSNARDSERITPVIIVTDFSGGDEKESDEILRGLSCESKDGKLQASDYKNETRKICHSLLESEAGITKCGRDLAREVATVKHPSLLEFEENVPSRIPSADPVTVLNERGLVDKEDFDSESDDEHRMPKSLDLAVEKTELIVVNPEGNGENIPCDEEEGSVSGKDEYKVGTADQGQHVALSMGLQQGELCSYGEQAGDRVEVSKSDNLQQSCMHRCTDGVKCVLEGLFMNKVASQDIKLSGNFNPVGELSDVSPRSCFMGQEDVLKTPSLDQHVDVTIPNTVTDQPLDVSAPNTVTDQPLDVSAPNTVTDQYIDVSARNHLTDQCNDVSAPNTVTDQYLDVSAQNTISDQCIDVSASGSALHQDHDDSSSDQDVSVAGVTSGKDPNLLETNIPPDHDPDSSLSDILSDQTQSGKSQTDSIEENRAEVKLSRGAANEGLQSKTQGAVRNRRIKRLIQTNIQTAGQATSCGKQTGQSSGSTSIREQGVHSSTAAASNLHRDLPSSLLAVDIAIQKTVSQVSETHNEVDISEISDNQERYTTRTPPTNTSTSTSGYDVVAAESLGHITFRQAQEVTFNDMLACALSFFDVLFWICLAITIIILEICSCGHQNSNI